MMPLSMVEIRLNDPRGPISVLLSDVLKYDCACTLNSKWSCSFSTSGSMKCLYFFIFFYFRGKAKGFTLGSQVKQQQGKCLVC